MFFGNLVIYNWQFIIGNGQLAMAIGNLETGNDN